MDLGVGPAGASDCTLLVNEGRGQPLSLAPHAGDVGDILQHTSETRTHKSRRAQHAASGVTLVATRRLSQRGHTHHLFGFNQALRRQPSRVQPSPVPEIPYQRQALPQPSTLNSQPPALRPKQRHLCAARMGASPCPSFLAKSLALAPFLAPPFFATGGGEECRRLTSFPGGGRADAPGVGCGVEGRSRVHLGVM